ncbi:MAG: HDOD domain-containing protein [Thermodesulfobacteriota bacterium]
MSSKRVLFVDDEPNVLAGLRRMLHPLRKGLDMAFVESGREALEAMAEKAYDVVVVDMRMPGMSGDELLKKIQEQYPETIRLILTGQAHNEAMLRTVGVAHQVLDKPCEPERLKIVLHRACKLHQILTNKNLRQLVARIDSLPSLPSIYARVQRLLTDPESSVDDVAQCIASDVGMSAKVLQLVNSAFFGLFQQVGSPAQAVHLLGLDTIKSLVLSVQIFSQYEENNIKILSLDKLWKHSLATGTCAKRIAESECSGNKEIIDDAFISGLLHDVGKLVLAANMPEEYHRVLELADREKIHHWEAEKRILEASHAEVGAYLLGLWGLPSAVMEGVIYHHQPAASPEKKFGPVTAVHSANFLDHEKNREGGEEIRCSLDRAYLANLGYENSLPGWRKSCSTQEGEQQ